MDDGRASFRQISQRHFLTARTVSSRIVTPHKAGLIKKFIPILSGDWVNPRGHDPFDALVFRFGTEARGEDLAKMRGR